MYAIVQDTMKWLKACVLTLFYVCFKLLTVYDRYDRLTLAIFRLNIQQFIFQALVYLNSL